MMNQSGNLILKSKLNFKRATKEFFKNYSTKSKKYHLSATAKYPEAKKIPLPNNMETITHTETARWSPHRSRDLNGPAILWHASNSLNYKSDSNRVNTINFQNYDFKPDTFNTENKMEQHSGLINNSSLQNDYTECYDCNGAVSLNSTMQTNVPSPYKSGCTTYFNMPGGQWEQNNKFIAEDMRKSHYLNSFRQLSSNSNQEPISKTIETTGSPVAPQQKLTNKEKLKAAIKDYGMTVVVFHVAISLTSLGLCYLAVLNGLDVSAFLTKIGFSSEDTVAKIASGAGTFVVAYALHKCFIPVRMSMTAVCVPIIVRYLRKIGFLKVPKK